MTDHYGIVRSQSTSLRGTGLGEGRGAHRVDSVCVCVYGDSGEVETN